MGRSCILVEYRNRTVMLDCGLHTQKRGEEALPFLDLAPDLEKVQCVNVLNLSFQMQPTS